MVLTIDGRTGEVVAYESKGSNLTNVRIINLEPGTTGYRLLDPLMQPRWDGVSASLDGIALFSHEEMQSGVYTVVRITPEGNEETVTAFSPPQSLTERIFSVLGMILPLAPASPSLTDATGGSGAGGSGSGGRVCSGVGLPLPDPDSLLKASEGAAGEPSLSLTQCGGSGSGSGGGGSGGGSGGGGTGGGGGGCYPGVIQRSVVGSEWFWTPLIINHAPSDGTSYASGGFSHAKGVYVMPYGMRSEAEAGDTVSTENGMTVGVFTLGFWERIRETYQTSSCGWYYQYTARMPYDNGDRYTVFLYWDSTWHDMDDANSVSGSGYDSLRFNTRYALRDGSVNTHSGAPMSSYVSEKMLFSIGATVDFDAGSISASAFRAETSDQSSYYYQYSYPGYGAWNHDNLGGTGKGRAFCRTDYVGCP